MWRPAMEAISLAEAASFAVAKEAPLNFRQVRREPGVENKNGVVLNCVGGGCDRKLMHVAYQLT